MNHKVLIKIISFRYLLSVPKGTSSDYTDILNVSLGEDGLIPKDDVINKVDKYELLKITQCLLGSQSCPVVDFLKKMLISIQPGVCQRPAISYVCDEENAADEYISKIFPLTNLGEKTNYLEDAALKYEFTIEEACLNRINFFIVCNDGKNELAPLYQNLCGHNSNCELKQTFKMCTIDPLASALGNLKEFRKFRIKVPEEKQKFDSSFSPGQENCVCESESIVVEDAESGKCSFYSIKEDLPSGNYEYYLCTNFYRRVELEDYEKDLALQVVYGACDSVRLKYKLENDFPIATILPTRAVSPNGVEFRADLPIPLSRKTSFQLDEAGFLWKSGSMRELVPQACRYSFQSESSSVFVRRIAFDKNPGEPDSLLEYGKCPNTDIDFCGTSTHIYFAAARIVSYSNFTVTKKHFGSAKECPLFCRATEGCTAASYDASESFCLLYNDFGGVVDLSSFDTGTNYVQKGFAEIEEGTDGVFICIDPAAEQIIPAPPPAPPLRQCPSGHSLVVLPDAPKTCVRSVCNPDTELAVYLYPKKECTGECATLCKNAPGRELVVETTAQPALWTILNPTNQVDYSYNATLNLQQSPSFLYAFQNVQAETVVELKRIDVFLPPTRPINCTALQNFTAPMQHEKFNFTWELMDSNSATIASGSGTENATFFFLDRPRYTILTIDTVNNNPMDIPVQSYSSLQLNVTVLSYTPYHTPIQFLIRGNECPCSSVNIAGFGVEAHTADTWAAVQTNQTLYQNLTDKFKCNETVFNNTALYGNPGYVNLNLCRKSPDPEVCVPHTKCTEKEQYLVHQGTLERDTECAQQIHCLVDEFESVPATQSSPRVCDPIIECSDLEYENAGATPSSSPECIAVELCDSNTQFKNVEANNCVEITECSVNQQKTSIPATGFSDAVCVDYEVECTETEVESFPQTSSAERVCTAATICAPNEYESVEASLTSDRTCTPMLKCSVHEIEHRPGVFTEDIFCEPVVHFSISWFLGVSYSVCFALCFGWMTYGRYRYEGYSSVIEAQPINELAQDY